MTIAVICPHCQVTLNLRDEFAGKQGKCPKCQGIILVPALAPLAGMTAIHATAVDPESVAMSPPAAQQRHAGMRPPGPPGHPHPAPPSSLSSPAISSPNRPVATAARAKPTQPVAPIAAKRTPQLVFNQVMQGFQGELESKPFSLAYLLGTILTTLFMIALPLIYCGLIFGVIYAVYYHLTYHHGIFQNVRGKAAAGALAIYVAPVVAGGIQVLFMIKPLFARGAKLTGKRSLSPEAEPILFAFVHRICEIVGAPRPKRIDVDCDINASASFRRGWVSIITGTDLVLTIGMPLAAGLNLRQFAGVLAHEFGHFSQGAGMRLTYVIRSINMWFMRVVYERDEWDQWLANSTDGVDIRIGIVLYAAKLGVWITRKILWVLMMLGHGVAGLMLRQMEFDADSYEARLVGSHCFESTARKLTVLQFAYQGAQSDLSEFYREGRLVDNLPKLIEINVPQIPAELRAKLDQLVDERKTGWFDTHPADKERIAAANRFTPTGIFQSNLETTDLFTNFQRTSREVTTDFYTDIFGKAPAPEELHSVDHLLKHQQQAKQASEARNRFFIGPHLPIRPVRFPSQYLSQPADLGASRDRLLAARNQMIQMAPQYQTLVTEYDRLDTLILQTWQITAGLKAGVAISKENFERTYASGTECYHARENYELHQARMSDWLTQFDRTAGDRLFAAAELLFASQIAARISDANTKRDECVKLITLISTIALHLSSVLDLRNATGSTAVLLGDLERHNNDEKFMNDLISRLKGLPEKISAVRSPFSGLAYPFDHAKGPIGMATYLLETIPSSEDLGESFGAANTLLTNLFAVYGRSIDRLCEIAEEVETCLGLPPLEPLPALPEKTT